MFHIYLIADNKLLRQNRKELKTKLFNKRINKPVGRTRNRRFLKNRD